MNCRGCNCELNDYLDMFVHNLMENCDRDSAIEFMEQNTGITASKGESNG